MNNDVFKSKVMFLLGYLENLSEADFGILVNGKRQYISYPERYIEGILTLVKELKEMAE